MSPVMKIEEIRFGVEVNTSTFYFPITILLLQSWMNWSVNKYYCAVFRQDNIRLAGKSPLVKPKSEPHPVEH